MFCPQCGAHTEAHIKFCKACGFKLSDFDARLPAPTNAEEAQKQLYRLKGTLALGLNLLCWLPSLLSILLAMNLGGRAENHFLTLFFLFLLLPFAANGWGLFNLWRSGFFKTYKEQRIRAEAALLAAAKEPAPLPTPRPALSERAPSVVTAAPLFGESVTEHTTRALQPQPGNSGRIG